MHHCALIRPAHHRVANAHWAATHLALSIQAELLVSIPKGVDIGSNANPNLTAFGAQTINTLFVAPGTKVTFVNDDAINHEIHSDGTFRFLKKHLKWPPE